ncbi:MULTISPECIES: SDR family NAD(P)-dependent oxidoreductase [unclassified Exiguobacterium]|uniref:SDR family NAD(P)-dependent oxidoreductase n=1 Tax=unclassified Exiguobacterium TaxID=2644629 RepID=UPI00103DE2C5|nr:MULTISPECIES: SDR family oxidoreductase [unclassified Exiguobacterium]TCI45835.1 SDR family oxidoreductase [Exiguobacterium sp. SH5S32]TCI51591.1 SDR family oxidoreductase [Exiguobacterium sp. SH1S4]TCI71578.1 SDR family oxidoreductase [Exiguobacterium sp. SH1S1]
MGTFLVTGATSGIGRAVALRLTEEGHDVLGVGRDETRGAALELESDNTITFLKCDLSQADEVEALMDRLVADQVVLHGVFNNAATFGRPGTPERLPASAFDEVFELNVLATNRLIQRAIPLLATGSSVVNNAAIVGHVKFPPMLGPYAASKAAVIALTKTFAHRMKGKIRFNAVCFGPVDTPLSHKLYGGETKFKDAMSHHFRGNAASPEEVAPVVTFLLSDASSYINGQAITIDGGYSLS